MSDKQAEYLRLLQERNRLKKQMNAKSKEQLAKEELEKGFNTHFRTAQMQRTTVAGSTPAPSLVVSNTATPLQIVATQTRGAAKEKDLSPDSEGGSKSVKSRRGNKGWGSNIQAGIFHAAKHADLDGDSKSLFDSNFPRGDPIAEDGDKLRGETDEYESDFDDHDSDAAMASEQQSKLYQEQVQEQEQEEEEEEQRTMHEQQDGDLEELDMDQSLVQRISSLGAQQKQRLLSLLLHESGVEKSGPLLIPVPVPVPAAASMPAPSPAPAPAPSPVPAASAWPGPRPSCVKLRILTCRDNAKMVRDV